MNRATTCLLAVALWTAVTPAAADSGDEAHFAALAVSAHPATVTEVEMNGDRADRYSELASRIGLDYSREYGYQEWADEKRANDIGVSGQHEWLKCSTGEVGDNEFCPTNDALDTSMYWESMYYGAHDVTVVYRVRRTDDGSYVRLLKLADGRVPDLHRR